MSYNQKNSYRNDQYPHCIVQYRPYLRNLAISLLFIIFFCFNAHYSNIGIRQDKKLFFLDAKCFNVHIKLQHGNVNNSTLKQTVTLLFMYFVKTPFWLKKLFKDYTWHIDTSDKELYLTFDDGPHPVATPFVLKQLAACNAKGSFFCLGKNVLQYPELFQHIIQSGHAVGNHTHNHLNGWKTSLKEYVDNVAQASAHINSSLFRPPYGRISHKAGRSLRAQGHRIVMWDVLSGDFDRKLSPENCKKNVIENAVSGSIVVFHDSEKAFPNLQYALPAVLEFFDNKGFSFKSIPDN